jgi:flagellum-specific ATP synthase
MAGAGVGKSTLLGMMARNTEADVTVVALIGERSREVKKFVQGELGELGLARSVVVSSTSNTAVALRIRAARVATSIAEYFRDKGLRVLLLMDSLTRVCMAQRELGLATGEPPTTRGYPPSAFDIIPQLLERAGPGTQGGSITACYTALLEGDDLTDPIGDAIRAVTDGHIVLSRKLAEQGHFPAIDVLASTSRVMSEVTTVAHRRAAADVRRVLSDLFEAEELQSVAAYEPGTVPRFDRAMALGPEIRSFLRQRSDDASDFGATENAVLTLGERVRQSEKGGAA